MHEIALNQNILLNEQNKQKPKFCAQKKNLCVFYSTPFGKFETIEYKSKNIISYDVYALFITFL